MAAPDDRDETPRWREDFPIDWGDDHYVTRRELAKFLTLGSALLVLANAAIAAFGGRPKSQRFAERSLGPASALAVGESQQFRYPTEADPCILVRTAEGLCAYSQVCTHLSCAVVHRTEENDLFCPCHHGVFAVADGHPAAGPPMRPLPRIKLVERDGEILAVGVER